MSVYAQSTALVMLWPRLRRRLPFRARFALRAAALAQDPATLVALLRLRHADGAADELVALRLRPLGGATVQVRPGTTDLWVATETLRPALHLPDGEVDARDARVVWDLGANIGVTMAHLAVRLPRARVIGVELDAGNAALARRNVAAFDGRCEVLHGGVWTRDGTIAYQREAGHEVAFHIGAGTATAPALPLNALLEHSGGGPVDYVKMDIEGAERSVLREATQWARHVRAIRVEVHPPYTVAQCCADLEALGFAAVPVRRPAGYEGMEPVVGVRASVASSVTAAPRFADEGDPPPRTAAA
jgi:FkbM family methyltransferase